jgi:ATP-grasp ribosomal peptide maturase
MTVLVLADEFDVTVDRVINALTDRDVPIFRCDAREFPQQLTLAARLGPTTGSWDGVLRNQHREVQLSEIRSVWYRRPTHFALPVGMSAAEQRLAAGEARMGFGGVLSALPVLFVNHPARDADAAYKPAQLAAARRSGLPVPPTLITNDPGQVSRFADEVGGQVVSKMLAASAFVEEGVPKIVYTSKLNPDDLADLRGVSSTAHLFQQWVGPKSFEARVTVVGDTIFAAAIHARSAEASVDWRSDYEALDYDRVEPPEQIREGMLRFMRHFGLMFGGFDFAIDHAGKWWFFECNSAAQFGWLESAAGLPISDTLAALLASGQS